MESIKLLKKEFITYIFHEKGACHAMPSHMEKHLVMSFGLAI